MPTDYLPQHGQAFCEWLEKWKVEFAAVASGLGFGGPEVTAVLADASGALYACRSAADASSYARRSARCEEPSGPPINSKAATPSGVAAGFALRAAP